MTAGELIELLKKYPPETHLAFYDGTDFDYPLEFGWIQEEEDPHKDRLEENKWPIGTLWFTYAGA